MQLFERLASIHEKWDVLRHPFYVRWSNGELTPEELSFYAGEYRHAVTALAEASEAAADACEPAVRAQLEEHAREEREHIPLWEEFARAMGADTDREPRPETTECAGTWSGGADVLDHLVTLYAVESAQPAISKTKLDGLLTHYGLDEGPATEYFALHAERDREHAEEGRALLEQRVADADVERLAACAEAALRANWGLLDGVERHFGR